MTDYKAISEATNELVRNCHYAASKAGWWSCPKTGERSTPEYIQQLVPTKLMLIVSEVSEAMEGHRKDKMDDHLPERKAIEVELADAMIRIADLAGALELDLGGALAEKMAYNAQRADHKLENRMQAGGKKY